jgi:hypothetical protein
MGGVDSRDSVGELRRGSDIVVVTPGLMRDLVNSGKLNMSAVRIFVIDEADRMTDAENLGIVMDAFTKIPKVLIVCFSSGVVPTNHGFVFACWIVPGCHGFGHAIASLPLLGNAALPRNRKAF